MTSLGLEIDSAQARCGLGDSLHNALWFSRSSCAQGLLNTHRCSAMRLNVRTHVLLVLQDFPPRAEAATSCPPAS
jgi:hypothetical protein